MTKPPPWFQRSIFVLFLGWPGMILWMCGFLSFVIAVFSTVVGLEDFWPQGAFQLGSTLGISCIGFAMFNAARVLTGWRPRQHSARAPAIWITCQFGALKLGGMACSCLLGLLALLITGSFSVRLAIAIPVAVSGTIATTVFYRAFKRSQLSEKPEESA